MYIKLYGKIWGGGASQRGWVLCNFLKILMVSDKTIHVAFRAHTTIFKQSPLEEFLISTIYQNHIGFNIARKKSIRFKPMIFRSSDEDLV